MNKSERKKNMKKYISVITAVIFALVFSLSVYAGGGGDTEASGDVGAAVEYGKTVDAVSAILIEAGSGAVLYEQNADEALCPASVTKTMTMLLVLEAVDSGKISLDDTVSASENAASMGGSQIFLSPGEEMTVDDLLKSMIVASANDAALALAEYVCGSEEAFVARMNERAKELGCKNTHFENPTGLDDTASGHVMSARDIAVISREVIKHELVYNYSTIWMDTIRDGAFGLTNTNRLIRFYKGATGLKTGSTSKAKFCISATAERGGLTLIAVIMAAPTRDIRNEAAKSLFDYGFANYSLYTDEPEEFENIYVTGGKENLTKGVSSGFSAVVSKGDAGKIEKVTDVPEKLSAPIVKGEKIGTVTYILDGKSIGASDILAAESVDKITFWSLLKKLGSWFLCSPPN